MKNKLTYENVYVEITVLSNNDVITTSNFNGKGDELDYEW